MSFIAFWRWLTKSERDLGHSPIVSYQDQLAPSHCCFSGSACFIFLGCKGVLMFPLDTAALLQADVSQLVLAGARPLREFITELLNKIP
jgi:hypothetical protein